MMTNTFVWCQRHQDGLAGIMMVSLLEYFISCRLNTSLSHTSPSDGNKPNHLYAGNFWKSFIQFFYFYFIIYVILKRMAFIRKRNVCGKHHIFICGTYQDIIQSEFIYNNI